MVLYGKNKNNGFFSETIVVYDIKVGRCSQLNESYMSTKGQLTLVQITQIQYFQTYFPQ